MHYLRPISAALIISIFIFSCDRKDRDIALPRSTPEAEGISSGAIMSFVEAAGKEANEIHSFMLLRHGKVVAEGWWEPYRADLKHTMYSLSKSLTSTAIGFAVSEDLLSVDDRVISFFPHEVPETLSTKLASMTVKDLLMMSAGQDPDPTIRVASNSENWVKAFLNTPVVDKPGSRFLYNSLATFMLSAIVQKVTGQKVLDYLKPRLFDPLGIEGADWEENSQGINTGGWGLRLRTEDIAKIGQFYLLRGKWNGRQILPAAWIDEATSFKIDQVPSAPQTVKDSSDWMQGYCYQFWRCRYNAYRGDGAYGQYMIIMPDQDAVVAITSETRDMQKELNLVWKYLLPAMRNDKLPENIDQLTLLRQKLESLSLAPVIKNSFSTIQKQIDGKRYLFNSNKDQLKSLMLSFNDSTVRLSVKKGSNDYDLNFAPGRWHYGETEMPGPNLVANRNIDELRPFRVAGSYAWLDNNSIELTLRYIESPHTLTITCIFLDEKAGVSMKSIFNENKNEPLTEGFPDNTR